MGTDRTPRSIIRLRYPDQQMVPVVLLKIVSLCREVQGEKERINLKKLFLSPRG
jgi:hypothetical protein